MTTFIPRTAYEHRCTDHMPAEAENGDLARCECGRWLYKDVDLFGIWWPAKRRHRKAIAALTATDSED